jgi:hypothetical protein
VRWALLSSVDELDGVSSALTVLHQHGHGVLTPRQGTGQGLGWTLHHLLTKRESETVREGESRVRKGLKKKRQIFGLYNTIKHNRGH